MSPLDDLTYDVITVLQKKSKALEAYDKYISDADADDDDELKELFNAMRRQDEEHVQVLKEVLAQRLAEDLGYEDAEGSDDDDTEDFEEEDENEIEDAEVDETVNASNGAPASAGSAGNPQRRSESTPRQR